MAAYAVRADPEAPLNALVVGEIEPPEVPSGWVQVQVKAAALNHHDIWSLRGVGLAADRLPMILGCDAAGVTEDGREVIVHAVINAPDFIGSDATYDPRRSLALRALSGHVCDARAGAACQSGGQAARAELCRGGLPADGLAHGVPDALQPSGARPGDTVLIQGAGGGVATALYRSRPARRDAHLGYLAGRGARARERSARGAPGFPDRRPAAGASGCGDGDCRCCDLVTFDQCTEAGRHAGDLWHDVRRQSRQSGADQDLLQTASGASARQWVPGTS